MTSSTPFVKQEINPISFLSKLGIIALLSLCFYFFDKQYFFVWAIVIFFILTLAARAIFFPNSLYDGIALIRQSKFKEAIPVIQESIEFYDKRPWIDKYRFVLLISSSKNSIKESSICNLAYCYLQVGEVQKAKGIYEKVLKNNPDNANATAMLNTINIILTNAIKT